MDVAGVGSGVGVVPPEVPPVVAEERAAFEPVDGTSEDRQPLRTNIIVKKWQIIFLPKLHISMLIASRTLSVHLDYPMRKDF